MTTDEIREGLADKGWDCSNEQIEQELAELRRKGLTARMPLGTA